jgi:hypothetical protein
VEAGQAAGRSDARRVTVTEAAWILDTTVDALRKRVQRGTIPHERDEYGRVWIMVDTDRTRQDTTGPRADTDRPQYELDALISEMRGRIEDLRAQLEAERQGHAESRRLLAAALERIPPQLEPPSEPPGASEMATPQPGRVEPQPAVESTEEPREASEMHMPEVGGGPQPPSERPWWRRMFGG